MSCIQRVGGMLALKKSFNRLENNLICMAKYYICFVQFNFCECELKKENFIDLCFFNFNKAYYIYYLSTSTNSETILRWVFCRADGMVYRLNIEAEIDASSSQCTDLKLPLDMSNSNYIHRTWLEHPHHLNTSLAVWVSINTLIKFYCDTLCVPLSYPVVRRQPGNPGLQFINTDLHLPMHYCELFIFMVLLFSLIS